MRSLFCTAEGSASPHQQSLTSTVLVVPEKWGRGQCSGNRWVRYYLSLTQAQRSVGVYQVLYALPLSRAADLRVALWIGGMRAMVSVVLPFWRAAVAYVLACWQGLVSWCYIKHLPGIFTEACWSLTEFKGVFIRRISNQANHCRKHFNVM